MGEHAKLSPSSSTRWMACTPSPKLESGFPNTSSSFADEGTLAHAICEDMLRLEHGFITQDQYDKQMTIHIANKYYNDEMLGFCQDYVDFVNLSACEPDTYIFIEQRLDMTNYVPDGFGTGDALVIRDRVLKFFDLKYGKGVKVSAVNNSQLKIYALGALNDYGHIFEVETIELNIFQPRLDGASTWAISVADLLDWAENELKPKALLAIDGLGEYVPGEHCRFCKAKAQCRALAEFNLSLAEMAFRDPDLMEDDELADVLNKKDLFTNWIGAVESYVFNQALQGNKIPGFKLVHGRSTRSYGNKGDVETKLVEAGYMDIYTKPDLLGITELTKRIGKKPFADIVEPLLIKPAGKATLVPESDKRPEVSSIDEAASVFDDEIGEDVI